jgi:hypothetical protein
LPTRWKKRGSLILKTDIPFTPGNLSSSQICAIIGYERDKKVRGVCLVEDIFAERRGNICAPEVTFRALMSETLAYREAIDSCCSFDGIRKGWMLSNHNATILHRKGPAFIALLRVASSFSQKLRVAGVLLVSGKKDKTPLWCEDRFPSHPRCFDTEPVHVIEYACATTQDLKHLSIFAAIMIYSCCLISPHSSHLILSLGS